MDKPTDRSVAESDTPEPPCEQCMDNKLYGMGPSHDGSKRCESGSIASGGTRAHCSCSTCF
jgi:hypothetical protein